MRNKYVIPQIWITKSDCLTHFLAGSGPSSGSGQGIIGNKNDNKQHTSEVTPTPGSESDLIQHSKQFDAWSSWDE